MHKNTMGLIFSENPDTSLGELTSCRSLAAVPVGGRYRLIDFALSNMVNSGITNVGITTPHRYKSLLDHLGTGKDWDMDRKQDGLFLLSSDESREDANGVLGGVDILYNVMSYLKRSKQRYVIVSDCNMICNLTFGDALRAHEEKDAEVTMLYTKEPERLLPREVRTKIFFTVGQDEIIEDMQVHPSTQKSVNTYMNMFIIGREQLISLVEDCVSHGRHKLTKDLLMGAVNRERAYGYRFDGYKKKINNTQTFYEFNLDLLQKEVREELFGRQTDNRIYTKTKDSNPTRYGPESKAVNSFIADGCTIEGKVRNSVLFRGVHVGKGTVVENSVIMQDSDIMENCAVTNCIFDKEVILRSGKRLIGQDTFPLVVGKKTIV
uniref:Glucose-1-phosphate adenylyltransferase subunit GlgD n=1 Tax=uncultured Bacillota bacterium TaxID=344338 RepID=A0A650EMF9_9FIRM|nr:glucose-1-phosphate adenylyltransferase subunit GlgD [uncultured Firmicutes bacterium]